MWVGYAREEWNGHLPPFRRHSCRWLAHGGSEEALRQVLRHLWSEYFLTTGEATSACPWEGLF